MRAVTDFVSDQRAFDFFNNFFARWNFRERQSDRGTMQAIEMFVELENSAVIQTQAFPNCVATLHHRIKWADAGFVAMHKPPIDVDDQVAVFLVKLLKHALTANHRMTQIVLL